MMSHVQPDVKLIVILRDPVQMTYSTYKFFRMPGSLPGVEEFHECVVNSIEVCVIEYTRLLSVYTYFAFSIQYQNVTFIHRKGTFIG